MTHIAIQEALDGKVVEWMEQVSDAQYGRDAQLASRSFTAPSRSTETSCDTPRSAIVTP
jgi:4-carboxymuconolactone decarboxylase